MPVRYVKNKVIEVHISGIDWMHVENTARVISMVAKRTGAYLKRGMTEKKGKEYHTVVYLSGEAGGGAPAKKLVEQIAARKIPFRGNEFIIPNDVDVRFKLTEQVTEQITLKNLEKEPIKPKTTEEEELRTRAGLEPYTFIACSSDINKVNTFINTVITKMSENGCQTIFRKMYRCKAKSRLTEIRESYTASTEFEGRPGYNIIIKMRVPLGKEGFLQKVEPIEIKYEPIVNEFPAILEAIKKYPAIRKVVEARVNPDKLNPFIKQKNETKRVNPAIAKALGNDEAEIREYVREYEELINSDIKFFEEYRVFYQTWKSSLRNTIAKIEIVPEQPTYGKKIPAKLLIDGVPYGGVTYGSSSPSGTINIPFKTRVIGIPIYNVSGEKIKHSIVLITARYSIEVKNPNKEDYCAVIWVLAKTKCIAILGKLRNANPNRISMSPGRQRAPEGKCEEY